MGPRMTDHFVLFEFRHLKTILKLLNPGKIVFVVLDGHRRRKSWRESNLRVRDQKKNKGQGASSSSEREEIGLTARLLKKRTRVKVLLRGARIVVSTSVEKSSRHTSCKPE